MLSNLKAAFVGLVVGDALGTTLEFSSRRHSHFHTEMTGGGPFQMPPGGWTDDTSMALCLADSLIQYPEFNPADLMNRFTNWWQYGHNSHTGTCFDIGITTSAALKKYQDTGDPYSGNTDPRAAGNGSLMRLAPVVLAYHSSVSKMKEVARLQSRTTHAAGECEYYCEVFAELLLQAASGSANVKTELSRDNVKSSGYVKHTYEAALWSVATTDTFKDALIAAVNLGDDADTVGAVTGQLAGAVYGMDSIPEEWLNKILWREEIIERADKLLKSDI